MGRGQRAISTAAASPVTLQEQLSCVYIPHSPKIFQVLARAWREADDKTYWQRDSDNIPAQAKKFEAWIRYQVNLNHLSLSDLNKKEVKIDLTKDWWANSTDESLSISWESSNLSEKQAAYKRISHLINSLRKYLISQEITRKISPKIGPSLREGLFAPRVSV
jgi:hypothetical protein